VESQSGNEDEKVANQVWGKGYYIFYRMTSVGWWRWMSSF
jgi:hypothetical protein